ncbi:hypothetical protein CKA32_005545 [Geitlerinema sp. FC II]|nr:hypothetical protein CKA32_005545 [Geitlerinema sp. FC II]
MIRNPHTITPLKAIAQNRFKSWRTGNLRRGPQNKVFKPGFCMRFGFRISFEKINILICLSVGC